MATSSSIMGSVDDSSDVYYDFSCTSCAKDGKQHEAVISCLDCVQNLCHVCLHHHNKFESMKRHRIVDKAGMQSTVRQGATSQPGGECSIHPGKEIELFCQSHDVVCCAVCITIYHRSCLGIDHLSEVAVGIKTGKEIKEVKGDIKQVKLKLNELQNARQADSKRINQEKVKSLVAIDNLRDKIVSHLDLMVRKAKDEVKTKHAALENKIQADINTLQDMATTLATNHQHLADYQAKSETQVFVHVKEGKNNTIKGKELLQKMKTSAEKETVNFTINNTIHEYLMNQKSLGEISTKERRHSKSASSAVLHGDFEVKISSDAETCDITGICLLADGSMLITDINNDKLKRLDKLYKVVDHCDMPGWPWGVCRTGPTEVAVALSASKKIQLVSTTADKLKLKKRFKVDGKCRDVVFNNDKLFISFCEPNPKVCIYNLSGKQLHTYQNILAGNPIFSRPTQIAVSTDGTKVYIADCLTDGVIIFEQKAQQFLQSTFTDPLLKYSWGLCMLENDNLLVSGADSGTIIQMDSEWGRVRANVLLSQTDGIKQPHALTYDEDNSRLIVSMMEADHIKVFNLTRK